MSKQPAASGSKSPSQFHTDEGAKQSRSAAQKLHEKAISYCQEPRFLRLFTPDKHDDVRTKLAAYHGRMGTELFVGLRDSVRFRMVTNSRFATFVPIAPEPVCSLFRHLEHRGLEAVRHPGQHLGGIPAPPRDCEGPSIDRESGVAVETQTLGAEYFLFVLSISYSRILTICLI